MLIRLETRRGEAALVNVAGIVMVAGIHGEPGFCVATYANGGTEEFTRAAIGAVAAQFGFVRLTLKGDGRDASMDVPCLVNVAHVGRIIESPGTTYVHFTMIEDHVRSIRVTETVDEIEWLVRR